MDDARIRAVVHEVLGTHADETILDYLCGVLEDEHFPWEDAFDSLGPILVRRSWARTGTRRRLCTCVCALGIRLGSGECGSAAMLACGWLGRRGAAGACSLSLRERPRRAANACLHTQLVSTQLVGSAARVQPCPARASACGAGPTPLRLLLRRRSALPGGLWLLRERWRGAGGVRQAGQQTG